MSAWGCARPGQIVCSRKSAFVPHGMPVERKGVKLRCQRGVDLGHVGKRDYGKANGVIEADCNGNRGNTR